MIALAHSCRDFLPIMDMVAVLGEAVGLQNDLTTTHLSIHDDTAGALILAETLPPQHTPQVSIMLLRPFGFVRRESKKKSS